MALSLIAVAREPEHRQVLNLVLHRRVHEILRVDYFRTVDCGPRLGL
jgi:hypothetical protein